MDLSVDAWREAILFIIALVLSVGVHEFGHAWVASRLGDPLPAAQGRLTLNPLRHLDPIGTVLLPFMMVMAAGTPIGWGKPVQTNPSSYSRRWSRPTASLFVALSGPLMNLLMATLVSVIIIAGAKAGFVQADLADGLIRYLVQLNLVLLFFNLLPIPPLDGGDLLAWVLPRSMQGVIEFLSRWGFFILIGLMLTGALSWLMGPAYAMIRLWVSVLRGAAGV
ncbi:MAG TPA: site-2 protease family protein [Polyangia bacterium]